MARSSSIAAVSWGTDADTLGSLMTLASGRVTSSPSSARSSLTRCPSSRNSGKEASTLAASEMSRSSTVTPAAALNAWMTGSSEAVARAGASSVWV